MAGSNLQDLQRLRDKTGAGVMECQRALAEAKGNFDRAVAIIHERGFAKVAKRANREAGAGLITSYIHNERIGVLLDLRAETDFVVRSDPFRALARELAMQIAASDPKDVEALVGQPYIRDETRTVRDLMAETIAKVGENIQVRRFSRFEL